jgi:hypothetical protein
MNFSDTYELNRIVAYVREGQLPLEHKVALPPFRDTKVIQDGKGRGEGAESKGEEAHSI